MVVVVGSSTMSRRVDSGCPEEAAHEFELAARGVGQVGGLVLLLLRHEDMDVAGPGYAGGREELCLAMMVPGKPRRQSQVKAYSSRLSGSVVCGPGP